MNKFCCVGVHCGQVFRNMPRQWFDTEKAAIEHAQEIIARTVRSGHEPISLIIAQAVRVVEPEMSLPPIKTRKPKEGDF